MSLPPADSVKIVDEPAASRYEARDREALVGILEYRRYPKRITLIHTEVRPDQEGRGIGARLAQFALDDARATGHRVTPTCPFVRRYLGRHPEYADILTSAVDTITP
jgi:predicted GNAT family acetyltransferase